MSSAQLSQNHKNEGVSARIMKRKGTAKSKSAIRDGRERLHFVDRGRARHRR